MIVLETVDEIIDSLGGTNEVARALGTSASAVSQWRNRGLPPDTFLVLYGLLRAKNMTAPASLWSMKEIAS